MGFKRSLVRIQSARPFLEDTARARLSQIIYKLLTATWQLAAGVARRCAAMKTTHLTSYRLATLGLAAFVTTISPARAETDKITGPQVHDNLAVYFVHGADA